MTTWLLKIDRLLGAVADLRDVADGIVSVAQVLQDGRSAARVVRSPIRRKVSGS